MHKIRIETFNSGITTTAKCDSSSSGLLVVRKPAAVKILTTSDSSLPGSFSCQLRIPGWQIHVNKGTPHAPKPCLFLYSGDVDWRFNLMRGMQQDQMPQIFYFSKGLVISAFVLRFIFVCEWVVVTCCRRRFCQANMTKSEHLVCPVHEQSLRQLLPRLKLQLYPYLSHLKDLAQHMQQSKEPELINTLDHAREGRNKYNWECGVFFKFLIYFSLCGHFHDRLYL